MGAVVALAELSADPGCDDLLLHDEPARQAADAATRSIEKVRKIGIQKFEFTCCKLETKAPLKLQAIVRLITVDTTARWFVANWMFFYCGEVRVQAMGSVHAAADCLYRQT